MLRTKRRLAALALAMASLGGWPSVAVALVPPCVCEMVFINNLWERLNGRLTKYNPNDQRDDKNGGTKERLIHLSGRFAWYFTTEGPPNNVLGQLKQIQRENSQNRAATLQQTKQDETLAQYLVMQLRETKVLQTVGDNDAYSAVATTASRIPGSCSSGQTAAALGSGTALQAQAGQTFGISGRQSFGRVRNPVDETDRVLAMADAGRIPEFVGADAGTLNETQVDQYFDAVTMLMPIPPRMPGALPDRVKDRELATTYEAMFRKAETAQAFFHKPFAREAALMFPSVAMTPAMEREWSHVSGPGVGDELAESGSGASVFPSHLNLLSPASRPDGEFISERDLIRLEVYKRFANGQYQSDPQYGLAAMGSQEALLKELLAVSNARSRMLYEMMNARLHRSQYLSTLIAPQLLKEYRTAMESIEARLAAD